MIPELTETSEKILNPYDPPFDKWSEEVLEAYKTFPQLNGMNAPICASTEEAWRQWCKAHPLRLWPAAVRFYAQEKKRKSALRSRSPSV